MTAPRFSVGDIVRETTGGVMMTVKSVERGSWSGHQMLTCSWPGASRPIIVYAHEVTLVRAAESSGHEQEKP